MYKKAILIFSSVLLIFLVISIILISNQYPEKALDRYSSKNSLILQNLKKINLDKTHVMFFTKDNMSELNLVIIKKEFLNNWKVNSNFHYAFEYEKFNDYLDKAILIGENDTKYNLTSHWDNLSCNQNSENTGILYGFFNKSYKEIYVNDKKCSIEKISDNLFLYYIFINYGKFDYKVVQ